VRGGCSLDDEARAKLATVLLPALLACGGPSLYLPLLAFAGAQPPSTCRDLFSRSNTLDAWRAPPSNAHPKCTGAGPTTLLYLFVPPVALLQFRRAQQGDGAPARLLPGGTPLLLGLAAVAVAMLLTSGTLALTKLAGV